MGKLITLKKNKEFRLLFNRGKSISDKNLVLYYLNKSQESPRIGFVVSKKVGKAVRRNRIKRLLREAYRLNIEKIHNGYDLILIPRQRIDESDFKSIEKSLLNLCRKAGILNKEKDEKR